MEAHKILRYKIHVSKKRGAREELTAIDYHHKCKPPILSVCDLGERTDVSVHLNRFINNGG